MWRMLLAAAALLLSCADAVNRRGLNQTSLVVEVVQSGAALTEESSTRSWSNLVSTLWSELVIEEDAAPIDFAKEDKAVKDKFLSDCVLVLDVHVDSVESVDKVVKEKCTKAGGSPAECTDMIKTLGEARKDEKLKPWCDKTFGWFAAKTKPRCLKKCGALLCKNRCDQQSLVDDESDKVAAYQIKLDTVETQAARFQKIADAEKDTLAQIDKLDKEKCTPAGADVTKLEGSQSAIDKDLGALKKATATATAANDKAFDALKKLRADKDAKKPAVSAAEAAYDKASATLKKARKDQGEKNDSSIDMAKKVTYARGVKELQCRKLKDMQAEFDAGKKSNDAELKALATKKTTLKESMDKAVAKKKTLEDALKAAIKAA